MQVVHEEIRKLSHEAATVVKQEGGDNDLQQRIHDHPFFSPVRDRLPELLDPTTYIGRAPQQVSLRFFRQFLEDLRNILTLNCRRKLHAGKISVKWVHICCFFFILPQRRPLRQHNVLVFCR